jgi:hypothetical protein
MLQCGHLEISSRGRALACGQVDGGSTGIGGGFTGVREAGLGWGLVRSCA